ncbi:LTA synthase family protein [Candidatus Enterococcus clewellii]|uniref:LTA synthase family protein n=1 Tax=Candidatus Enterococcus clewellii TaxID=1834193 RepID=UPI001120C809|nr:sulfatase-like hydrolase/transferase [Enterococcus sp. 9E7_DIV0242]
MFVYTVILGKTVESVELPIYFAITVVITLIFLGITMFIQSENSLVTKKENRKKSKIQLFMLVFYSLVVFFSLLLYTSSIWLINTFGPISIEQLLYSMQTLGGTNTDQVYTFIDNPLIISVFTTYLFIKVVLLLWNNTILKKNEGRRVKRKQKKWTKLILPTVVFSTFAASILLSVNTVGFAQVKLYFGQSSMIETEFVDAKNTNLAFPEQKRNLIYIFAESLEGSFTSEELGGTQKNNLLQELTDLTNEGAINFSNSDKIGGAYQVPGTEYTAAGIVSQTSGMPLKAPTADLNSFGQGDIYSDGKARFLPGLTSIGEILEEQGYNQTFIMGSPAIFGGRSTYLSQHGNYHLFDLQEARNRELIPQDYNHWWGFEDNKLFEYAKSEALALADKGEPFNLTMLTSDTHFPDGLLDDKPTPYDNQYANVIAYSSKQITEFIRWCQQQPFYENTTIVVSGDHLTMDQNFVKDFPEDYERTIFNLYINSPIQAEDNRSKNREFGSFDLFPTTLAALNVTISGDRLGMGTNLFSDKSTVIERQTLASVRDEFTQRSEFYDKHILNYDEKSYNSDDESNDSSQTETTSEAVVESSTVSSTTGTIGTTPSIPVVTEEQTTDAVTEQVIE